MSELFQPPPPRTSILEFLMRWGDFRVLSVQQPYATALILGTKRIENRTWFTHIRGPVIIQASVGRSWMRDYDEVKALWPGLPPASDLPFGRLVGHTNLTDCRHIRSMSFTGPLADQERWACGPHCFITQDPVAFSPEDQLAVKGRQGFFYLRQVLAA